jgi:hypothetical protein
VLLLPILGGLIYGFDLLAGMFFYRRAETQLIAHMLWGAGIVTSFLLLTAVFILAR